MKTLHERLQIGIKPWEWDFENYQNDPEMYGYFYPEDVLNLEAIEEYERSIKK